MTETTSAVVVTYASSPISVAVARAFGTHGAHVVVTDPDASAATRAAEQISHGTSQPTAAAVAADLADVDACRRVLARACEPTGMVDVWVNGLAGAAGPGRPTPPPKDGGIAGEAISQTLNACMVAGKHMAEQGHGVIVNLMTVDAIQHERGRLTESVIAGATRSMTGALGVELGEEKVRVVGVALGAIATPTTTRVPIARLLTHDDVANAVLFVAGPTASFLTAETLVVDGGQSSYHLF